MPKVIRVDDKIEECIELWIASKISMIMQRYDIEDSSRLIAKIMVSIGSGLEHPNFFNAIDDCIVETIKKYGTKESCPNPET